MRMPTFYFKKFTFFFKKYGVSASWKIELRQWRQEWKLGVNFF